MEKSMSIFNTVIKIKPVSILKQQRWHGQVHEYDTAEHIEPGVWKTLNCGRGPRALWLAIETSNQNREYNITEKWQRLFMCKIWFPNMYFFIIKHSLFYWFCGESFNSQEIFKPYCWSKINVDRVPVDDRLQEKDLELALELSLQSSVECCISPIKPERIPQKSSPVSSTPPLSDEDSSSEFNGNIIWYWEILIINYNYRILL